VGLPFWQRMIKSLPRSIFIGLIRPDRPKNFNKPHCIRVSLSTQTDLPHDLFYFTYEIIHFIHPSFQTKRPTKTRIPTKYLHFLFITVPDPTWQSFVEFQMSINLFIRGVFSKSYIRIPHPTYWPQCTVQFLRKNPSNRFDKWSLNRFPQRKNRVNRAWKKK
jgi:hypothetical protein